MKDSKIKIRASINGHGILLITKAVVGVRDGLLVESLTYFGDDMEFREPSRIIAYNKRDGRTYEFEASSIGPVTTKYGHFHLIRCTQECKPSNRRKSERYEIDRLGVIRINKRPDIRNALVYDISMRGIAFILDSEAKCRLGDKITASFRYDPNYFHFYACEATVVRAFTIDSQVAIGCTIDSMGADLVTLISNRRKAKMGIDDKEILPISKSSDEDIASGKKIAVNYVPPIPQEELHKLQEPELLSPEDAADLIPEKNEREYIENRASRVADIDVVSVFANSAPSKEFLDELDSIEDRSPEYLKELNSIEDRTPKKAASKPAPKEDKAPAPKKEPAKPAPQKEKAPAVKPRQKTIADNLSLDNFDGFFNQKGNSVDEGLFAASRNDGFLTPEQIADIIELEHIHNG